MRKQSLSLWCLKSNPFLYPDHKLSHSCGEDDETQELDKECGMEENCLGAVHAQIPIWHGGKGAAHIVKYIKWYIISTVSAGISICSQRHLQSNVSIANH